MPTYSLKGGDKAMVRNIVGRFHVGMSEAEVADAVVAKLKVHAPAHVISALRRYVVQVHRGNQKLYRHVTGGMNPHRARLNRGGRWYFGLKKGGGTEAFHSKTKPTEKSHGSRYGAVVGPFPSAEVAKYGKDRHRRWHPGPHTIIRRGKVSLHENPRRSRRNDGMKEYALGSSSLVYAPGVVRWAMHGYKTSRGKERAKFVTIIKDTWHIPKEVALGLLQGKFPTHLDGEALAFKAPEKQRMLFNRRRR